eukprot:GHVU01143121.1.p1 GENE.GHVU01143121.1~~GHVU01143121.1.p1  ORF type:complete len:112 (-),score=8.33 GHVU01143121.1:587-922(-)
MCSGGPQAWLNESHVNASIYQENRTNEGGSSLCASPSTPAVAARSQVETCVREKGAAGVCTRCRRVVLIGGGVVPGGHPSGTKKAVDICEYEIQYCLAPIYIFIKPFVQWQ